MRTLLVDADIVAFTCAAQTNTTIDWDNDGSKSQYGNAEQAKAATKASLDKLKEQLDADQLIVCLSDPSRRYFRHDVYPPYKQSRTHGTPPADLGLVKDMLRDGSLGYPVKCIATLEADDVLGILATHPTLVKGEKVVVSSDKDLKQIAGRHYDPRTDRSFDVSEDEGDKFFFTQCLTGDTCDGYPGCPKVGPVKAEAALNTASLEWEKDQNSSPSPLSWQQWLWAGVVRMYELRGLSPETALTQARVARICRHTDYDFVEKRVKLWTP